MDTFFDIEPQKRSPVTKLGAQTQHRVIERFVPPSASKQSELTCARDKCVVFHNNIGQVISGSTFCPAQRPSIKSHAQHVTNQCSDTTARGSQQNNIYRTRFAEHRIAQR